VSIDEGEPASVVAGGPRSDRLDGEGDEQAGKARVAVATAAMNLCLRGSIDLMTPGEWRGFHLVATRLMDGTDRMAEPFWLRRVTPFARARTLQRSLLAIR